MTPTQRKRKLLVDAYIDLFNDKRQTGISLTARLILDTCQDQLWLERQAIGNTADSWQLTMAG